jgi:hypothetical protein
MKVRTRDEYAKRKIKFFTKENCPFCTDLDKNEVIYETEKWIIAYNKYPYF